MLLERFQMLDRIAKLDLAAGVIMAHSDVPLESPVFEGHFPGHALMPGVLLLETMAQASGYLLLAMSEFERMPFFASAKEANFRAFTHPGAALTIEAECTHSGSGYAVTKAAIDISGRRACDAKLVFRTLPFHSPELRDYVRSEGRRLGLLAEEREAHA